MKRFVSALGGLFALGWSGMAFAQASTSNINTPCPPSFMCAFTAAETLALGTPKTLGLPGQPDVFVGYMAFDATGSTFAMSGTQNLNGTITSFSLSTKSGTTCQSGSGGMPASVTLNDNSQLSYVLDSANNPTLLQFILTNDPSTNTKPPTTNSVRVGSCHKLI